LGHLVNIKSNKELDWQLV